LLLKLKFIYFFDFIDSFRGGSWWYTSISDWARRDWICWKAYQWETPTITSRK